MMKQFFYCLLGCFFFAIQTSLPMMDSTVGPFFNGKPVDAEKVRTHRKVKSNSDAVLQPSSSAQSYAPLLFPKPIAERKLRHNDEAQEDKAVFEPRYPVRDDSCCDSCIRCCVGADSCCMCTSMAVIFYGFIWLKNVMEPVQQK